MRKEREPLKIEIGGFTVVMDLKKRKETTIKEQGKIIQRKILHYTGSHFKI